jgi:lysophospholipase L1-like esterase
MSLRKYFVGEPLAAASMNQPWEDALTQSGHLIDGSDFAGFSKATDLDALLLPAIEPAIFATEGVECNVYYNTLALAPTSAAAKPSVLCNRGAALSECWRWTSDGTDDTGIGSQFTLAIGPGAGAAPPFPALSTLIRIAKKTRAAKNIKVLLIGDSLTSSGAGHDLEVQLNALATADGTTAITLIGTQGSNPNKHEGHAGFTVNLFNTAGSPFYISGAFNFAQYLSTNSLATPDYVGIMLGVNDMSLQFNTLVPFDASIVAFARAQFAIIDQWIAQIRAVNASALIGIHTITPPATQDGFGALNGAANAAQRIAYIRKRQIWYREQIAWFANRTAGGVWLINTGSALDSVNSFAVTTAPASAHATINIARQINDVHPDTPGYKQIADAIWSALKNLYS